MDKYTIENKLKFVCYSLIGIFLFFVPISILGKTTIPLDHIVSYILKIPYFKEMWNNFGNNRSNIAILQKELE